MNKSLLLFVLILLAVCVSLPEACGKSSYEQVQMWYTEGRDWRAQGEPDKAMAVFLKAAHSGTDDEALLGRVWSNIAEICRQADEHMLADQIYAAAAEHFAASKDAQAYANALNDMAWERAVMGYKDSALALIDAAMEVYPLYPLSDKAMETHAVACLTAEEYDSVLYYTMPPDNNCRMLLRAQAYAAMQINDSAVWYARTLLEWTDDLSYMDDIYHILMHNDPDADDEMISELSAKRMEVQQALGQRHGKLVKAVRLLLDDRLAQPTDWRAILELSLMGCLCLVAALLGIMTILQRRRTFRQWKDEE